MPEIEMPQLGESVTEGTITRWFKQVGERVEVDEPLFEVSTDKVDSEVPAPEAGWVTEIKVPEGDTVDVGTVLVVLSETAPGDAPAAGAEAEAPPAASPEQPAPQAAPAPAPAPAPEPVAEAPAAPPAPEPAPAPSTESAPSDPGAIDGKLLSPLVRRLIAENGLDASQITGTGVGGRITREDVLKLIDEKAGPGSVSAPSTATVDATATEAPAAPSAPASAYSSAPAPAPSAPVAKRAGDIVEPLNNIRRLTGEHMVMSLATSPHAITAIDVDFEGVDRVRGEFKDQFKTEEGFSLTYLPFISRAVVDALGEFPHMNSSVGDGALIVHNEINLSIAVDLEFEGLLAPVVKGADGLRLRAIAREINTLADRARNKRLSPDDLAGGTFTLSNSGSYGTFLVAPIINQPQVAILSTDGVRRRPVVVELPDGTESIAIHSVGNLTMSWDHRAFDGAYAAAFVARVKEIIETRDWAAEL